MVASLDIGMDEAKPGVVNIRTRNVSGHLPLKSTAVGLLLSLLPNIAIASSLPFRPAAPVALPVDFSNGNLHTNVLDLKKYFFILYYQLVTNERRLGIRVLPRISIRIIAKRETGAKRSTCLHQQSARERKNRVTGAVATIRLLAGDEVRKKILQ